MQPVQTAESPDTESTVEVSRLWTQGSQLPTSELPDLVTVDKLQLEPVITVHTHTPVIPKTAVTSLFRM